MTKEERIKDNLGCCNMAAQDCKEAADYAAYAFSQGNETQAREYVKRLEERVSLLRGAIHGLDYAHKHD